MRDPVLAGPTGQRVFCARGNKHQLQLRLKRSLRAATFWLQHWLISRLQTCWRHVFAGEEAAVQTAALAGHSVPA